VSSISGVIILAILLFANLQGKLDPFFFITSLGVVAALIGFLFYNWHPSKMYMGDTGSQFLGAFLSAASIHFIWNFRDLNGPAFQIRQFTTPLLVFAIPLIDTTTVSIRRLMRGSSPFVGGKDHITHHLAFLGFKDSTVAFIYLMLSIISAAIIIIIHSMRLETKYANALSIGYFFVLFMLIQLMYQKNAARHEQNKTA
jgi:UDP-GlcNAc:undecaprenyl-phosphate GlcNAc-1-phosphate transferase